MSQKQQLIWVGVALLGLALGLWVAVQAGWIVVITKTATPSS